MITKGIRGAITVEENSVDAIRTATLELLSELVKQNRINKENISHAIFTVTKDLDKVFPARFARLDFDWDNVAMMCFNEADIDGAIEKCLRILIVINCEKNFVPKFVYLKGAKNLRVK
ncbi:chorismate mutase [bacterium]|nr:chorismate mutase [bacterium]